jgi:hypothetical protein
MRKKNNCTTINILIGIVVLMGCYIIVKNSQSNTATSLVSAPAYQRPVYTGQDMTDTLSNVYAPPLRYGDMDFRQIGYLTARDVPGRLPLFGRQINRRDKWVYYTMDGGIKLSVSSGRRNCTQSPGCDSLSDRDTIDVEGTMFTVHLYDTKVIGY